MRPRRQLTSPLWRWQKNHLTHLYEDVFLCPSSYSDLRYRMEFGLEKPVWASVGTILVRSLSET